MVQVFRVMQGADSSRMELKVRRSGDTTLTVDLDREDRDWPLASRGLLLMADQHLVKARNMLEPSSSATTRRWLVPACIWGCRACLPDRCR